MSRVTPPVNKAINTLSRQFSTSQTTRLSPLLKFASRQTQESKAESNNTTIRSHTTLSRHRPTISKSSLTSNRRPLPLMQGFKTSAPKDAMFDFIPIDFMFFPTNTLKFEPIANLAIRMPLTPDNYTPNRSIGSGLEVESLDGPVHGRNIAIVAAHPEQVVSALTEVVGNEGLATMDHVNISFMPVEEIESPEPGMIRSIWGGIVNDVLGSSRMPKFA